MVSRIVERVLVLHDGMVRMVAARRAFWHKYLNLHFFLHLTDEDAGDSGDGTQYRSSTTYFNYSPSSSLSIRYWMKCTVYFDYLTVLIIKITYVFTVCWT